MTECIHSFLFCGGGEDRVCFGVEIYGWCNIAHAKRTLHIVYPNKASNTMVIGIPKINKYYIDYFIN